MSIAVVINNLLTILASESVVYSDRNGPDMNNHVNYKGEDILSVNKC